MTVSTIPSILERARALTKAQVWESLPETQRTSEPIKADDRPLQRLLLALRFQKLNFFKKFNF